jgi:hypothetical protein
MTSMNFVQRPQINSQKWDLLVAKTEHAGIYNYSYFLDSVCENWSIYVDDKYTMGIAIPFTKKLNYKIVYTPNFLRSVNFLGDITPDKAFTILSEIKKEFKSGDLSIENTSFAIEGETRVYQKVNSPIEISINTLSKRMLKKFEQSQLRISSNVELENIFSFLEFHLFQRIEGLTNSDLIVFKKLMNQLNELQLLRKYVVFDSKNELKGCSLLFEKDGRLTYIKGVANSKAMKEGAMYALLFQSLNLAKENNLVFDFGGSNIDSIRRFYSNLGGQDMNYYRIKWGNLPIYYKIAKYIYHFFRKLKR